MLACVMSGCGQKGEKADTADTAGTANTAEAADMAEAANTESEPVTIKFTYKQSGSDDALKKWLDEKQVIERFEAENPGIKVELTPLTSADGDYTTKLALQISNEKTTPDVIMEDTYMTASDAAAGYLTCLDDYLNEWEDWDQYIEGTKKAVEGADGKYYGVPISTDSRGIYYTKAIFQAAGIPVPWQPENWNDMLETAEKLKALKEENPEYADMIPFVLTVSKAAGEATTMQTFEQLLYGTGDEMYEDGKWLVGSQGILDTFRFINEVQNERDLGQPLSLALSADGSNIIIQEMFPKNQIGMRIDASSAAGSWLPTGSAPIENLEDVIGFAACPTQNGGNPPTISMTGGWSWAVPAYSAHKDEAFKFIAFCGNKENAAYRSIYDGRMAPRKDAMEIEDYAVRPFMKEFQDYLEYSYVRPKSEDYALISTQIQSIIEDLVTGNLTPEQASETYSKKVAEIAGEENTVTK